MFYGIVAQKNTLEGVPEQKGMRTFDIKFLLLFTLHKNKCIPNDLFMMHLTVALHPSYISNIRELNE